MPVVERTAITVGPGAALLNVGWRTQPRPSGVILNALTLAPDKGWKQRGCVRHALDADQLLHERQQFGLYAHLLAVQRRPGRPGGRVTLGAAPLRPVTFELGADGYPVAATETVLPAVDGRAAITRRFSFYGRITSGGVRWPGRIEVLADGAAPLVLEIDRFEATA